MIHDAEYHEKFMAPVEAYVIHRSKMMHLPGADIPLDWRAVVRTGHAMHWEWFNKKEDAINWVNKWKRNPGEL